MIPTAFYFLSCETYDMFLIRSNSCVEWIDVPNAHELDSPFSAYGFTEAAYRFPD